MVELMVLPRALAKCRSLPPSQSSHTKTLSPSNYKSLKEEAYGRQTTRRDHNTTDNRTS